MEYILAGCLAVVFLIVLFLIRDVKRDGVSLHALEGRLSPLQSEKSEPSEIPGSGSENGISPEVVAAIAAAVACIYPGAQIASLRRAPVKPQSAWRMAGLLENTRPF